MKKLSVYFIVSLIVSFSLLSLSCKNHAGNEPEGNFNEPEGDFVEFTLESDLSWLEGEWELEKLEVDDHGEVSDKTLFFTSDVLRIEGGTKDSVLVRKYQMAMSTSPEEFSSTVESFLFANSHISNKVNRERNVIVYISVDEEDSEKVFYYTYRKR